MRGVFLHREGAVFFQLSPTSARGYRKPCLDSVIYRNRPVIPLLRHGYVQADAIQITRSDTPTSLCAGFALQKIVFAGALLINIFDNLDAHDRLFILEFWVVFAILLVVTDVLQDVIEMLM